MQNIHVGRYSNPQQVGWEGWLEPADRSWIAFIDLAGRPTFYLHRNQRSGAVLEEDVKSGTEKRVPAGTVMPPES
jgi:hypothetical protein